ALQEHARPGHQVARPPRRSLLHPHRALAEVQGPHYGAQARMDRHRLDPAHDTIEQEAREDRRLIPVRRVHWCPRMMKRWILVFLAAAVVSLPLVAQEGEEGGAAKGAQVDTTGKGYTAAYLIEPSSKRVLVSENADVMLPTACMAKMMTCLIAMEEIKAGRLKLDTPVTISAFVSHMG